MHHFDSRCHLSKGSAVSEFDFLKLALAGVQYFLDQYAPRQIVLKFLLELHASAHAILYCS